MESNAMNLRANLSITGSNEAKRNKGKREFIQIKQILSQNLSTRRLLGLK